MKIFHDIRYKNMNFWDKMGTYFQKLLATDCFNSREEGRLPYLNLIDKAQSTIYAYGDWDDFRPEEISALEAAVERGVKTIEFIYRQSESVREQLLKLEESGKIKLYRDQKEDFPYRHFLVVDGKYSADGISTDPGELPEEMWILHRGSIPKEIEYDFKDIRHNILYGN